MDSHNSSSSKLWYAMYDNNNNNNNNNIYTRYIYIYIYSDVQGFTLTELGCRVTSWLVCCVSHMIMTLYDICKTIQLYAIYDFICTGKRNITRSISSLLPCFCHQPVTTYSRAASMEEAPWTAVISFIDCGQLYMYGHLDILQCAVDLPSSIDSYTLRSSLCLSCIFELQRLMYCVRRRLLRLIVDLDSASLKLTPTRFSYI